MSRLFCSSCTNADQKLLSCMSKLWSGTGATYPGTIVPATSYQLAEFPKAADSHFPPHWARQWVSMHKRSRSICLLNESGKEKMNGKIIAGLSYSLNRSGAKDAEANTSEQKDKAQDTDILLWITAQSASGDDWKWCVEI